MSRHHRRLLRRLRAAWGDGSRPRRCIALQHALAAAREELP